MKPSDRFQPKSLAKWVFSLLLAALSITVLFNANIAADGVKAGLTVCANLLIPSLFLFMVLSSFLSLTEFSAILSKPLSPVTTRIFKLPKELGTIVLLSLIGGYPVGAKMISQLVRDGQVSEDTASRMLCFCVNSGPSFLISAVGTGLFGSRRLGLCLFASQTLATLLVGALVSRKAPPPSSRPLKNGRRPGIAFVEAVTGSSASILTMCAFAVLFSGILHLMAQLGAGIRISQLLSPVIPYFTPQAAEAVLAGILEVTTGCINAAKLTFPASLVLTSCFVSFSGLSVLFQIISCFQGINLRFQPLILSRPLHCLLSSSIVYLLYCLFCRNELAQTVSADINVVMHSDSRSVLLAISLISMCTILVLSVKNSIKTRKSM